MHKDPAQPAQIAEKYREYDRQVTITNIQIGCLVGIVLMPAGVLLDWAVYPDRLEEFLKIRLLCSLLIGLFWTIVISPIGQRYYRLLGVTLAMFPASSIAWMIYATEGSNSPYYAGLNLVLLVIALVLSWTFLESLVAFSLTLVLYLAACGFSSQPFESGTFINNFYFLVLTGIIVVTGSYFQSRLRYREFALRFQLDENRRELEDRNRQLTELDQIKSRFFANISHELRTPLTLLLAPLEALLHSRQRALDPETRGLLQTMHANGMRLLKLINDLLDLVRLESGRMEVKDEPLEMVDLIQGLASAARQVAEDKHITLATVADPALGTVLADRDKLEKIILNLLFNALKFTPGGGRVELRGEKQGDSIVLTVADTGMGIAAKHLPLVFSRFFQGDDSSRKKFQGMGIGLALVKELAEIQGGKATVDSVEGKGTTFTVQIPYRKAERPPELSRRDIPGEVAPGHSEEWLANLYRRAELFPALTPLQPTGRPADADALDDRPSLLVADDEPDMLRFLKSQLSSSYRVLEATNGQQAVEKALQLLPDIILLDMMMPEKDGLQACQELRQHVPTQKIPVVILTARADEETKLTALSTGANDFLAKPFSTTELHLRLRNLLESYHLQRRLTRQNQVLETTLQQLKEAESQLVQSEKLASLGRMSAGIIHEINNPLNFAATGLFTLRNTERFLAPEHQAEFSEVLRDIEEGINRVKNIVLDLRTFTHPNSEGADPIKVAEVVETALRFLSNETKDQVKVDVQITEGLMVMANRSRLTQVVVNLLQNSLDAIHRKTFQDEEPIVSIRAARQDGRVKTTFRDNGTGIPATVIDKIFDPFFTTKDVGEGVGLGLSICYRIVHGYGGRIVVNSEEGRFTEFTLDFPAVEPTPSAPVPAP